MLNVPTFVGPDERVLTVSAILQQSQQQLTQLKLAMLANNHSEDDEIPDWTGKHPVPTYGKRIGQFESGMQRIMEANGDIADEIAEEAHQRRKQGARQRKLDAAKRDEELADAEHEREKAGQAKG